MSLDTIMNLSIVIEDRAPSQAGFGLPLLFGYHVHWIDRKTKLYAAADDMLDDGFTTDDALYKAAQIVKSQNPSPDTFLVGRRVTPLTQIVILTPKNTTAGFKYKGTIGGLAFSYTVLTSATPTSVGAAIAALITTLAVGFTAVSVTGVVTLTNTVPGDVIDLDFDDDTTGPEVLSVKDATVDTTTDDELPIIDKENSSWYGLIIVDSSSKATSLNAAGWIETKRRIFIAQTADSEVLDSNVTDDIMSDLKDSSYARTGAIYHRAIGGKEWLAAGWLAGGLTKDPGSATMAFKSVAGVRVDTLQAGEDSAVLAKNGSYYIDVGLPNTFEGKSGAGEYLDTVRFLDWVYARMRENVIATLSNNDKIPFTDTGVDIMRSCISSIIQLGIDAGGFAKTPVPTVTAPKVADVPQVDKIGRILPDLDWTATLAGAIHRVNPARGRVSV